MRREYITFIVGILVGGAVIRFFFWPAILEKETIVTEYELVEVETLKIEPIFIEANPKPVSTAPSAEPAKYDSARRYSGTFDHEFGRVDWSAETFGALNRFEIKPIFSVPQTTTTRVRDSKTTVTRAARGVFAGAGVGWPRLQPVPAVAVQLDKNIITYEYNPWMNSHQLTYFIKIF